MQRCGTLARMRSTERITVTLPTELAEKLRQRVSSGQAESVSGLLAEITDEWFREENVEQFLADMAEGADPITDEHREWAENVLRSARGE